MADVWSKWDDDLPEEIRKQFLKCNTGVSVLDSLTIPRSYFTENVARKKLHMFGDSSMNIFCAVFFFVSDLRVHLRPN